MAGQSRLGHDLGGELRVDAAAAALMTMVMPCGGERCLLLGAAAFMLMVMAGAGAAAGRRWDGAGPRPGVAGDLDRVEARGPGATSAKTCAAARPRSWPW